MTEHELTVRVTAYLLLLILSGLLGSMPYGPWAPLSALGRILRVAVCAVRAIMARSRMMSGPSTQRSPEEPVPTARLSSIELALVAQVNRELACAQDEVAEDARERPETRQTARATAVALRERARVFELEAHRRGAEPTLPSAVTTPAYTGPERRQGSRRDAARRDGRQAMLDALGERDRRTGSDRRQGDRRRMRVVVS